MQRGAPAVWSGQIPAIHRRRFIYGYIQYFSAYGRLGQTITRRISNPHLRLTELVDFLELQAYTDCLPLGERVADRIGLDLRYGKVGSVAEKGVVEHSPVGPFQSSAQYRRCAQGVRCYSRRKLGQRSWQ